MLVAFKYIRTTHLQIDTYLIFSWLLQQWLCHLKDNFTNTLNTSKVRSKLSVIMKLNSSQVFNWTFREICHVSACLIDNNSLYPALTYSWTYCMSCSLLCGKSRSNSTMTIICYESHQLFQGQSEMWHVEFFNF